MIAVANMIKSVSRAESAIDRTTADGFENSGPRIAGLGIRENEDER